jgi:hypothetical protein
MKGVKVANPVSHANLASPVNRASKMLPATKPRPRGSRAANGANRAPSARKSRDNRRIQNRHQRYRLPMPQHPTLQAKSRAVVGVVGVVVGANVVKGGRSNRLKPTTHRKS